MGVDWKESRSSQGCAETQDVKSRQVGGCRTIRFSVFFQFVLNVRKEITLILFTSNGSMCVCTALTEPGQLPLGCHGAARLVWRSPGLPATFRAKSHGMSDGMQTTIMVLVKFFFSGTF